jgi:hypothetical protein
MMIEVSTAVVIIVALGWFILQQRHQTRVAHATWVADATYLYRNALEWVGRESEAEEATELADALILGLGIVVHKLPRSDISGKKIERAALKASGEQWLSKLGVGSHSTNHQSARGALFWLAGKFSDKQ